MYVHTTDKVADHTCMDPQVYRIVENIYCRCLQLLMHILMVLNLL